MNFFFEKIDVFSQFFTMIVDPSLVFSIPILQNGYTSVHSMNTVRFLVCRAVLDPGGAFLFVVSALR